MKFVPEEEVAYVKMKKYVHVDCENYIDDFRNIYELCGDMYRLLEGHSYVYKKLEF